MDLRETHRSTKKQRKPQPRPPPLSTSSFSPLSLATHSSDKKQLGAPLRIGEGATFHSLSTDAYSLHCLESPTGLKFVLMTTENASFAPPPSSSTTTTAATTTATTTTPDIRDILARIYAYAYVDGAARSPTFKRGEPFAFELFSQRLRSCLGGLLPDSGGTAAR